METQICSHVTTGEESAGQIVLCDAVLPHTRLFVNHMLETPRACQAVVEVQLSVCFKKNINWVCAYLPSTNGVYMMHADC